MRITKPEEKKLWGFAKENLIKRFKYLEVCLEVKTFKSSADKIDLHERASTLDVFLSSVFI